MNRKFWKHPTW